PAKTPIPRFFGVPESCLLTGFPLSPLSPMVLPAPCLFRILPTISLTATATKNRRAAGRKNGWHGDCINKSASKAAQRIMP
ncbi:MAG: hypothetical protein ACKO0N_01335, partial [Planctomycetota bacterium]